MILRHLLYWAKYILSKLIPKKQNLWVFGSNKYTFNDNSKYFYLYVIQNRKDIDAVWITHSINLYKEMKVCGYNVEYINTFKGFITCLRANVAVFSHSFMGISSLCGGSRKIALWHGIPLKKMGKDIVNNDEYRLINSLFSLNHMHQYDLFLSPCITFTEIMSKAYNIRRNIFFHSTYPRLEPILSGNYIEHLEKNTLIQERELYLKLIQQYKYRYLYMPTWRDRVNSNILLKPNILDIINNLMIERNSIFIIKLHELEKIQINVEKFTHICIVNSKFDIYPIIPFINLLITDYSSILFDFYFTNSKILFFPFDKEDYTNNRGLYFNYEDVCIGKIVLNTNDLLKELNNISLEISIEEVIDRENVIKKFWEGDPLEANSKLFEKINSII